MPPSPAATSIVLGGRPSTTSAWTLRPSSGPSLSSAVVVGGPPAAGGTPGSGCSSGPRGARERLANGDPPRFLTGAPLGRTRLSGLRPGAGAAARRLVVRSAEPVPGVPVGVLELRQPRARPHAMQAPVEDEPLLVIADLRPDLRGPIGTLVE